jgi:hypothetical protein
MSELGFYSGVGLCLFRNFPFCGDSRENFEKACGISWNYFCSSYGGCFTVQGLFL